MGTEFSLTMVYTPGEDVPLATGVLEASGVISLVETPDLEWYNLPANKEVTVQATLRIEDPGEGAIRGGALVLDKEGKALYGRSESIYFLVSEEEVLTGTSSPWLLKLEHLERAHKSGAINKEGYDEALEKVLGGGATETNEPLPSGS